MKIQEASVIRAIISVIVLCGLLGGCAGGQQGIKTAKQPRPQCPKVWDHEPIELGMTGGPRCVDLRSLDDGNRSNMTVLIPNQLPLTETDCPAIIKHEYPVHDQSVCQEVRDALKKKDRMEISGPKSGGPVMLRIWRGRPEQLFLEAELEELPVNLGGTDTVIGYRTKNLVEVPGANRRAHYAVYLRYFQKGNGRLGKYFGFEVFDEAEACLAEMPDAEVQEVDCGENPAPHNDVVLRSFQLPSGGGGEPPPN